MIEDKEWVWTAEVIHKLETYDTLLTALRFVQAKMRLSFIEGRADILLRDVIEDAIAAAEDEVSPSIAPK